MIRAVTPLLVLAALTVVPQGAAGPAEEIAAQAMAATPDAQHGMILYLMHCAGCHGRHAWGEGPREIPALAGQHERYLIAQLAHFLSGTRAGSEMHGPVMHDTLQLPDVGRAQAFRDLASYLAHAPRNPQPEYGDGRALSLGQRDYTRGCAGCHGHDGSGNEANAVPAIGGQSYDYLLSQLRNFASGRVAHPPVADSPVALGAAERSAVADYVSRMTYLTADVPH